MLVVLVRVTVPEEAHAARVCVRAHLLDLLLADLAVVRGEVDVHVLHERPAERDGVVGLGELAELGRLHPFEVVVAVVVVLLDERHVVVVLELRDEVDHVANLAAGDRLLLEKDVARDLDALPHPRRGLARLPRVALDLLHHLLLVGGLGLGVRDLGVVDVRVHDDLVLVLDALAALGLGLADRLPLRGR